MTLSLMFWQILFDRCTRTDEEQNNLKGTKSKSRKEKKGEKKKKHNMRVSIVAALDSHSRLLSCKYHTQRLLLAKFLCLVSHIWVDRSRTRAPPLLNPSQQQTDSHFHNFFPALCRCHFGPHMFTRLSWTRLNLRVMTSGLFIALFCSDVSWSGAVLM